MLGEKALDSTLVTSATSESDETLDELKINIRMICRCPVAHVNGKSLLAPIGRWCAPSRWAGSTCNLRKSLDICTDMPSVCGYVTSSTGRPTHTPQQCARHAENGHGPGRRNDVESNIKLDENFASFVESRL